jgi:hypothetical protein
MKNLFRYFLYSLLFIIFSLLTMAVYSPACCAAAAAAAGSGIGAPFGGSLRFDPPTYPQPMVWVNTLNFTFKGVMNNTVDAWHTHKQARLKDLGIIFKGRNVAEARVTILFTEEAKGLQSVSEDIPFLFVSGWKAEDLDEEQKVKARGMGFKDILCVKESNLDFHEDGDLKYLDLLTGFLLVSREKATRFQERFIRQLDDLETLRDTNTIVSKKPVPWFRGEKKEIFHGRFYHTEQTIYSFLTQDSIPDEIIMPIPEGAKVEAIILDIATKIDMCIDCGDLGAAIEALKTGYARTLLKKLNSVRKSNVAESEIFTLVSSQRSHTAYVGGLASEEEEWNSRDQSKTNFNHKMGDANIRLQDLQEFIPQKSVELT